MIIPNESYVQCASRHRYQPIGVSTLTPAINRDAGLPAFPTPIRSGARILSISVNGDDVMVSEGGVGSGHHRGGADPYSSGGRAGGQGVPRHSDGPTGQIYATTRRDERPEGAALFSVLPFPEPVTSARSFYGQRITREVFADAASKRFDMLTGKATVLKYADLPLTPVQPRVGTQK